MGSKMVFQFHFCSPYIMAGLLFYSAKTCLFMLNNFYVGKNTESVLSPLLPVCNFNCARGSQCYIFILYYNPFFHDTP